ncbi:PBAN-type neuropeptides-like [Diorhabda sublineata]|uniref:PBAN-type neuropeptides-like n=1 Tax=Diorhabda sublineata TaxID=1163346 RepID=UPI0024E16EB0|nr:PBAN-type neuropeptides-like [Diorhabda sublineata]
MDRTIRVSCVVILFTYICLELTLATQKLEANVINKKIKEEYEPKVPSVWFSPRLGRKKRTLGEDGYKMSEQEQQELFTALEESPFTLVAVNGNDKLICKNLQGKSSSYTPRLGRNVEEDNVNNEKWRETDISSEYLIQRSPPFAPRLGKRFVSYSPRLGRDL